MFMNTRDFDFSYLIIQAFTHFGKSHGEIKEAYRNYPMCLLEYIENGESEESIEIDFEQKNASVTYCFDANRTLHHSLIYFYEPSDVTLFRNYIEKHSESNCDETKRWFITGSFI